MDNLKRFTEAEICDAFDECYDELVSEGVPHKIEGLFCDRLGFLLIDVCEFLPHAPLPWTIKMVDSARSFKLGEAHVISYVFRYRLNSIGDNALLFIARTTERKIRLFTVETHRERFYLCEYCGYSHLNYGTVDPKMALKRVTEQLARNNFDQKRTKMEEYMPKTGDWGDKIIITLHSDGERRHKKWCDNYDENNCKVLCGKCVGSAHCDYYKNKNADSSHVFYRKEVGGGGTGEVSDEKPNCIGLWRERYRAASYGDKLLNKIVLIKKTPHTFRICEVTSEDFYFFTVEYDGREHRYEKRTAYRNHSVYIFCGLEFSENVEEV